MKLKVKIDDTGRAIVNDQPWPGLETEQAVRTANICMESRHSQTPCDCTCCQVYVAYQAWLKKGRK